MALSCTISAIKRDIGQKLRFFIPLAFDAPVTRWVSVGILLYRLMYKNWNGEKRLRICLTVSTLYSIVCNVFDWQCHLNQYIVNYRRVTDGWTDRQTDTLRRHSPRYAQHRMLKKLLRFFSRPK